MRLFIKGKSLLLSIGLFMAALIFGVALLKIDVAQPKQVYADISAEIRNIYTLGEEIDIPSAQLEIDGKTYTSNTSVVIYPDGKATKAKNLILNESGKYTVRYTVNTENGLIYSEKYFQVEKGVVSFNNSASSYSYGKNEDYQTKGLLIDMKADDEARINKVIDLSQADWSEPFIDFAFLPKTIGTPDAYKVYLKLTDAYDAENFIIVRIQNWSDVGSWADGACYMDACAPGQEWTSCVNKSQSKRKDTKGWYIANVSMTGRSGGQRVYTSLKLFYDAATKSMNTNSPGYEEGCLIDFDDSEWFDPQTEKLWGGFTTGECYASFYVERTNTSNINLCVKRLQDFDLSVSDKDNTAPIIFVDYNSETKENLPKAMVGYRYPIFDAKAIDLVDGEVKVINNVFYNDNGKKCIVDIKDGTFIPKKEGEYTIVYKAIDYSGNEALEILTITAQNYLQGLEVNVDGQATTGVTGADVKLFNSINIKNANGNATYNVVVEKPNKEKVDLQESNMIFADMAGEYKVTITVKDYVSVKNIKYSVEIQEGVRPLFDQEIFIPKYLIKGAMYQFETEYYATIYKDGSTEKLLSKLWVLENEGEAVEYSHSYAPTQEGTLTLSYQVELEGVIYENKFEVPVINVGYGEDLLLDRYFVETEGNVDFVINEDEFKIQANKDFEVDFINPVQAKEFNVTFDVDGALNNFEEVYFILTDSKDPSIALKVSYRRSISGDSARASLNNEDIWLEIGANFNGTSTDNFVLNYLNSNGQLLVAKGIYFTATRDLSGKEFNGFPSNFVYITFGLEGVSGESSIVLKNINNQAFYQMNYDSAKTEIYYDGQFGNRSLGESITLLPAIYSDVLDPTLRKSFYVLAPSGEFAIADDGTVLDGKQNSPDKTYTLILNEYGDYYFEFECAGTLNKGSRFYSFGISIVDVIAPSVSLSNITQNAKVGDTISLAKVTVSDDYTAEENLSVVYIVFNPDNTIMVIEGGTFVVEQAGEYIVYIYVTDEAGNSTFESYNVIVK